MSSQISDAVDEQMSQVNQTLIIGAICTGSIAAFGFAIAMAATSGVGIFFGLLIAVIGSVFWLAVIIRTAAKVIGHSVKAAIIEADGNSSTDEWPAD